MNISKNHENIKDWRPARGDHLILDYKIQILVFDIDRFFNWAVG